MPIPVGTSASVVSATGPGTPGATLQPVSLVLGDIVLGLTDEFGVEWRLVDLKGWFGPSSSTNPIDQRASDHGGLAGESFYGPRVIEIEGTLLASTWSDAAAVSERLTSSIPVSDLDLLFVTVGGSSLQAMVRQQGDPIVPTRTDVGLWGFSISLVAPDPRRYSVDEATASTGLPVTTGGLTLPEVLPLTIGATFTSGVLTAVNAGNTATRPTFTVNGPCPPFQINHLETGKSLRFADSLSAGRSLVIDTDKRRAILDGTASRTVTGTWFEYAPGTNTVSFTSSTYDAGATLTSQHRSAWR